MVPHLVVAKQHDEHDSNIALKKGNILVENNHFRIGNEEIVHGLPYLQVSFTAYSPVPRENILNRRKKKILRAYFLGLAVFSRRSRRRWGCGLLDSNRMSESSDSSRYWIFDRKVTVLFHIKIESRNFCAAMAKQMIKTSTSKYQVLIICNILHKKWREREKGKDKKKTQNKRTTIYTSWRRHLELEKAHKAKSSWSASKYLVGYLGNPFLTAQVMIGFRLSREDENRTSGGFWWTPGYSVHVSIHTTSQKAPKTCKHLQQSSSPAHTNERGTAYATRGDTI